MSVNRGRGRRATKGIQRAEVDVIGEVGSILTGKDGTRWEVIEQDNSGAGRRGKQNILRESPGPTSLPKRQIVEGRVLSAFSLLIDDFIIKHIQKCTESEARTKLKCESWVISYEEIYAVIGIMFARGVLAKGQSVDHLWSKTWGPPFFRKTMSRDRFKEIMKFLRFDIRSTRSDRLKTDKFALVSQVWDRFIGNCIVSYRPNEDIAVDEQLFPTKTRCPFIQYIASKPDKFGIKFWLAADVKSKYLLNGFPYLGKDVDRPTSQPLSEYVVLRLVEPYMGKGRNVTTDNFFTSVKLAEKLKAKNTSLVGTVNRARREIPQCVKQSREDRYKTHILKNKDSTLTVYQGKPSKNVLLLSTVHSTVGIGEGTKQIPETVSYYNSTKYGVDVVDQMARLYSTKAGSRRWPVQVFYNILDLAAINAAILYREVTGQNIARRDFILQLAVELQQAFKNTNANDDSSDSDTDMEVDISTTTRKRKQCQIRNCKKNKTSEICYKCKLAVCGKCTSKVSKRFICNNCI